MIEPRECKAAILRLIGPAGLVLLAMLAATGPAWAAPYRMVEGAEDSMIVLPQDFSARDRHGAIVLLPYTGGTGEDLFNWYYASSYGKRDGNTPVVVLLSDKGKRRKYRSSKAWAGTVEDYEEKVRAIVSEITTRYGVDPERIAVGGFSMGGDLGWALALRNPELFRGVVIMGSRCSWREPGGPSRLRKNGARFAFFAGTEDRAERLREQRSARELMTRSNVDILYSEMPGRGHLPAPPKLFWDAVDWLLDGSEAGVIKVSNTTEEPVQSAVMPPLRKSARHRATPPVEAIQ